MPKSTRPTAEASRATASGSAADLERVAKSRSGRIPKVQPNMAATRGKKVPQTKQQEAGTDAETRYYIDRSKADLKTLKGKLGDGKALAAASRNDLANSRTVMADADKREKRPKMTDTEQGAEFERVAREHGAEGDAEAFKGVLRKLAEPKVTTR